VGPGQTYSRIQDAIDNAAAGDTIRVYDGVYNERLTIGMAINLIGNGSIDTTINGGGSWSTIVLEGGWVNISGFKVTGSDPIRYMMGGIIINHTSGNNSIENCDLINNKLGIVIIEGDDNRIFNCTFTSNTLYGFETVGSAGNIIFNCTFQSNRMDAIFLRSHSDDNRLENCTFVNHMACIALEGKNLTLLNNSMEGVGLILRGLAFEDWSTHNIDGSNILNGKDFIYLKNLNGTLIPPDFGQIILANCTNMSIEDKFFPVPFQIGFCNNISIDNNTFDTNDTALEIWYSNNVNVSDNHVTNGYPAIYSLESDDVQFINNLIENSTMALCIGSNNNKIINNHIRNNTYFGIDLHGGDNLIENNLIEGNLEGMRLYHSNDNIIRNNRFYNNTEGGIYFYDRSERNVVDNNQIDNSLSGISVGGEEGNRLVNNELTNCGIRVWMDYWYHGTQHTIDTSNTVNGRPVYYWKNRTSGSVPSNAGQVILINCQGVNVKEVNVSNGSIGTFLGFSSGNHISNINASNCVSGIELWESTNNFIENSTISNGLYYGVGFKEESDKNVIKGNDFSDSTIGIQFMESHENEVFLNDFIGNEYGVNVTDSDFNVFYENTFIKNMKYGICIDNVYGSDAHWNEAYHNNFIDNNGGDTQGFDGGHLNNWSYNYWSDWTTPDQNSDWIVDYSYNISGNAWEQDDFPLTHPFSAQRIKPPLNLVAIEDLHYFERIRTRYEITDEIWYFSTNATWLTFLLNGSLSGTPENADVGTYWVNISTQQKYYSHFKNFTIEVLNVNDPPIILTKDVDICYEDQLYYVDYNATDIDPGEDNLTWELETSAGFLTLDDKTGVLSGTPNDGDLGQHSVRVTVYDVHMAWDAHEFMLGVVNVNDPPEGMNYTIGLTEDNSTYYIGINELFTDIDNSYLDYQVKLSKNITVQIADDVLEVTPIPDWNGLEILTVTASDGEFVAFALITVDVKAINDPPTAIQIEGFENKTETKTGIRLNLSASVEDVDLLFEGDSYTYLWTSNLSGELGKEKNLSNITFASGNHMITVKATDKEGESIRASIIIKVEEMVEEGEGNDDDDDASSLFFVLIIVSVIILILILFGMGIFFIYRYRPDLLEDVEEE
jgi:parallel beta-helix repeat protein